MPQAASGLRTQGSRLKGSSLADRVCHCRPHSSNSRAGRVIPIVPSCPTYSMRFPESVPACPPPISCSPSRPCPAAASWLPSSSQNLIHGPDFTGSSLALLRQRTRNVLEKSSGWLSRFGGSVYRAGSCKRMEAKAHIPGDSARRGAERVSKKRSRFMTSRPAWHAIYIHKCLTILEAP
jgi:hypothetical protein